MGWRCGERRLGYHFFFFVLFIFSRGWEYHASADVFFGGFTPSEMGWAPSIVRFPPSEVCVIWFWSGADIIPGVLDCMNRWCFCVVSRSLCSCVGFVDVWYWGGVSSVNFSVVSLNIFINVLSACVWRTGWFVSWSCNIFTASMSYFVTLVSASPDASMGTLLCCGYSWYWQETRCPLVVGPWNFKHL